MKILVDRLSETPLVESFAVTPEWVTEHVTAQHAASGVELDGEARVEVRAQRLGTNLYLEGELRGGLALACSRCLTSLSWPDPRAVPTRARAGG